mmetsp:Transcript_21926/g.39110  ORF Transcript_21926/g.39110 Transcript_21926/m.39110 type:complete len:180 (-) Transcript_21926:216-755(-)
MSSTDSKSPQEKRRSMVRWASSAVIRAMSKKTRSQNRDSWYQEEEYHAFKQECKETIKLARNSENSLSEHELESEDLCLRGLESMGACEDRRLAKKERRNQVYDVVYYLQDSSKPEEMADIMKRVSDASLADAQMQARRDEEESEVGPFSKLRNVRFATIRAFMTKKHGSRAGKLAKAA